MNSQKDKRSGLHIVGRLRNWGPGFGLVIGLLLAWEIATRTIQIRPSSLPSPTRLILELWREAPQLSFQAAITGWEAFLALAGSLIVGYLASGLSWISLSARRLIAPLLSFFSMLPLIILAPLVVIWFGFGSLPSVALAFLICVLPLTRELQEGWFSISSEAFETLGTMNASASQVFWKVQMPATLPYLFRGLRKALPLALTGVAVTEFVGADQGIGHILLHASSRADSVQVASALAVLILMALLGHFFLFAIERIWLPWARDDRAPESGIAANSGSLG
jgi:NitT/TauT family transport system permease protein